MTEDDFRTRLAALGLHLDAKAFAAAFAGALHLRAEVAKIQSYLTGSR